MRTNIRTKVLVILLSLFVALTNVACGPKSIQESITTTIGAIRAARKITTLQHAGGYITDDQYRSRLELFKALNKSVDALGDEIARFGEINATNKEAILERFRGVNRTIIALIGTGDLGVKNPQSKADFSKWVLLASGTLGSIELAIAASSKTINTKDVTIEKVEQ